ncbi:unnamed protein product [Allacma fusca]|uniref:Uncharacterized protein n=1 Tax=Allacma fusca TaxID=39272 RepID=A0A8J2PBH1_9HEXA|nr:unnamed protein product [Allacma fusca]
MLLFQGSLSAEDIFQNVVPFKESPENGSRGLLPQFRSWIDGLGQVDRKINSDHFRKILFLDGGEMVPAELRLQLNMLYDKVIGVCLVLLVLEQGFDTSYC